MDITPNKSSMSILEKKKDNETMWEYTQWLRDLTGQVYAPFLDKEIVTLFANMLNASYCEHMMDSST
jgi:hypothetical protein